MNAERMGDGSFKMGVNSKMMDPGAMNGVSLLICCLATLTDV